LIYADVHSSTSSKTHDDDKNNNVHGEDEEKDGVHFSTSGETHENDKHNDDFDEDLPRTNQGPKLLRGQKIKRRRRI
jgi:hypothetical protein